MSLVFIISQPRSGSTLLQSLVSNNPVVSTASEPWVLLPFIGIREPGLHSARYNYKWMRYGLDEFIQHKVGEAAYKAHVRELLLSLYQSLQGKDTRYILDKTPRYYEIVFQIREYFPAAKFIILKRHPFAVVNSIISSWKFCSLEKLSDYYHDLVNAPLILQAFLDKNKDDKNILEVHYEKLVLEPDENTRKIYEWLDLPFDSSVLDYSNNKKLYGRYGDQVGIVKHSKPVSDSLDSWKIMLKHPFWNNFLKGYSSHLGADFMQRYGEYECVGNGMTNEFRYYKHTYFRSKERKFEVSSELRLLTSCLYYYLQLGSASKDHMI